MILPSEMLVEHAPVSAPRAKKLVEHWLRRRHGSRAPGYVCAYHCAQLSYTTQHRTVKVNSGLTLSLYGTYTAGDRSKEE